ncbi:MAG: DUF1257 domain-containing protein [Deltaproteobacteria bacterium]|nr:DUF1257 domain-containing protein [Deltaproteobacteria bacterium]
MSVICVLTPIVIGSWPSIVAAVAGAASAMGFSTVTGAAAQAAASGYEQVRSQIPHSEVLAEALKGGEKIRVQKDGVIIEFGRSAEGACTVCVSGRRSKSELQRIGQEAAGRVVQQFAYHKLITELKQRRFTVVEEKVQPDASVQVRVKLG